MTPRISLAGALAALCLLLLAPWPALAADPTSISAITVTTNGQGQQEYSVSLQILLIMTALSFIPAFVMLMTMPVIGTQLVPVRVRLYLALGVCVVLVPNLPSMPQVDALSMKAMLLIGEQILVGALLGFSLQLLFHAFVIAGQIISMQMGLGFASMVDPANGVSVPVLGQFFTMLVTLLFLAMNGHLVVFEVIAESFVTLPVGEGLSGNHFWIIAGKLGWVMGAALLLALPAITALLVVNLAFGAMTRAAPQLNIFSIGFPLTLVLGLVILWIGTADLLSQYQVLAGEALQFLRELVRAK